MAFSLSRDLVAMIQPGVKSMIAGTLVEQRVATFPMLGIPLPGVADPVAEFCGPVEFAGRKNALMCPPDLQLGGGIYLYLTNYGGDALLEFRCWYRTNRDWRPLKDQAAYRLEFLRPTTQGNWFVLAQMNLGYVSHLRVDPLHHPVGGDFYVAQFSQFIDHEWPAAYTEKHYALAPLSGNLPSPFGPAARLRLYAEATHARFVVEAANWTSLYTE